MKRVKSTAIILSLTILISTLSSCTAPEDKVLNSLGEYKSKEFYTEGAFQDYTDYAKYYYDSVDFTDNEYFSKIQQSDIDILNEHLDDFDRSIIDSEDYLYINSEKHTWDDGYTSLVNYDVYFLIPKPIRYIIFTTTFRHLLRMHMKLPPKLQSP